MELLPLSFYTKFDVDIKFEVLEKSYHCSPLNKCVEGGDTLCYVYLEFKSLLISSTPGSNKGSFKHN